MTFPRHSNIFHGRSLLNAEIKLRMARNALKAAEIALETKQDEDSRRRTLRLIQDTLESTVPADSDVQPSPEKLQL